MYEEILTEAEETLFTVLRRKFFDYNKGDDSQKLEKSELDNLRELSDRIIEYKIKKYELAYS